MRVEIEPVTLRFEAPVATAFGELRERELLRLTIEGPDGVAGRGEAAPLEPYDGVPLAVVREALEAYRPRAGGRRRVRPAPSCSTRAGSSPTSPRPWLRSTWRCGTGRGGAREAGRAR